MQEALLSTTPRTHVALSSSWHAFRNRVLFCGQVYEDLRAITLSLDDVAEFTGMLDEDMDDVGY